MPTKTTKADAPYEIDGKQFAWHPLDDEDRRDTLAPIVIPLRIKVKLVRQISGFTDALGADEAMQILDLLIPDQADAVDDMDINDLMEMFNTYMREYQALSGASLGE